jgi:hypothetical protein
MLAVTPVSGVSGVGFIGYPVYMGVPVVLLVRKMLMVLINRYGGWMLSVARGTDAEQPERTGARSADAVAHWRMANGLIDDSCL